MTVPPEELLLAAQFPPSTRDDWRELALGVLRKSRPDLAADQVEQRLSRTTYDGVTVAALYDTGTADGVPGVHPYTRGTRTGGAWLVRQRHGLADPAATREAIPADLENGVTSLWLVVGDGGVPVDGLGEVLRGVYLDLAPVTSTRARRAAAEAFLDLVGGRDDAPGNLGADPLGWSARTGAPPTLDTAVGLARRCAGAIPPACARSPSTRTVYHDAGGSDAEELGCSAGRRRRLPAGAHRRRARPSTRRSASWSSATPPTADQFLDHRQAPRRPPAVGPGRRGVRRARGRAAQRQHAVTSSAMMTARDPWVNMLRTTLACFAAGVGGADAVTVQPFDARSACPTASPGGSPATPSRCCSRRPRRPGCSTRPAAPGTSSGSPTTWPRRPGTGSPRSSGPAAWPPRWTSGLVADRLAATWARRARQPGHRARPDHRRQRVPQPGRDSCRCGRRAPAARGGGLPRVRYAEEFEALRDRGRRRGHAAAVFLATLGPVAAHTARASFAANLFQAGGIATVTGDRDGGTAIDPARSPPRSPPAARRSPASAPATRLYAEHAAGRGRAR